MRLCPPHPTKREVQESILRMELFSSPDQISACKSGLASRETKVLARSCGFERQKEENVMELKKREKVKREKNGERK